MERFRREFGLMEKDWNGGWVKYNECQKVESENTQLRTQNAEQAREIERLKQEIEDRADSEKTISESLREVLDENDKLHAILDADIDGDNVPQ